MIKRTDKSSLTSHAIDGIILEMCFYGRDMTMFYPRLESMMPDIADTPLDCAFKFVLLIIQKLKSNMFLVKW